MTPVPLTGWLRSDGHGRAMSVARVVPRPANLSQLPAGANVLPAHLSIGLESAAGQNDCFRSDPISLIVVSSHDSDHDSRIVLSEAGHLGFV